MVEEKPEFSGGIQALTQHIQSNFKIPYDDYIQKRQGKIFVSCVINKNGDVKQVKIIRGISETLNYEAIQVVQSLPKWKPAKHNNQLVNVRYIFPINIKF